METKSSDRELIQRAQKGESDAITVLYARYRGKVLNYLYRFTGNRATAEELTQETFLRVFQNFHRYRPIGSVAGWIYRIAGNLALNSLRDRPSGRVISLDEPMTWKEETMDRKEALPSPSPQPDLEAVRAEEEAFIQQALLKVSPLYREALILCDIEGYPYREAAELLGCSINTIASRLARGRAQMARLLGFLKKEGF